MNIGTTTDAVGHRGERERPEHDRHRLVDREGRAGSTSTSSATIRTAGSSSSATSAVTNGTISAKAGRNARSTTTHENNVPRPVVAVHASSPPHAGHAASGYQHQRPHVVHRGMQSSPRAAPAK